MNEAGGDVTRLLGQIRAGNQAAADQPERREGQLNESSDLADTV